MQAPFSPLPPPEAKLKPCKVAPIAGKRPRPYGSKANEASTSLILAAELPGQKIKVFITISFFVPRKSYIPNSTTSLMGQKPARCFNPLSSIACFCACCPPESMGIQFIVFWALLLGFALNLNRDGPFKLSLRGSYSDYPKQIRLKEQSGRGAWTQSA